MPRSGRHRLALLVALTLTAGCAATTAGDFNTKLRRVGLEVVSDEAAALPPMRRDGCLPCRVVPGFPEPAFPSHPAGYLIVGVNRRPETRDRIVAAIEAWGAGHDLLLTVRRNPHTREDTEWWEADVRLRYPER